MDNAIPRHALYETEAMLRALDLQGAVLVPGVLDASLCATARAAIDALRPVHWDEARDDPRG
ncbi:MAG TPA: hypothetical protein VNT02_07775, partial [Burkholderiales bacterium]|nr:hypothetical protein [Burkholderiales bacterium]